MQECRILVEEDGRVLAERADVASTCWQRFCGLMLRAGIGRDYGLFLPRCRSVHTFFMRFPIDLVYVDGDACVKKVVDAKRPWRMSWCPGAESVLELAAGHAAEVGVGPGDRLRFDPMGEVAEAAADDKE